MSEIQQLEAMVQQLLDEAKKRGATAAEADVSVVTGLSATVRLGEVETVEYNKDRGLGLTVYFGKRKGSASTSDFHAGAIEETVAAACGIAKYTAEDEFSGLPEKDSLAFDYPELDLHHPWEIDSEKAVDLAKACEDAARGYDQRITNSEGASVSTHRGVRVYGNSLGFVGGYGTTRHSISCSVIAQQGESMERDHWYTSSRVPATLDDPEAVGFEAARRAVHRLNARKLATGVWPVLYIADVAGGLWSHFTGAIRGESLYRKSTFLLDSLGTQVFPDYVTLTEEPHLARAIGSAPFDGEGVRTRAHDIVRDGVVQSYILDTYSARKLGMTSTGNSGGVHNLHVRSGDQGLDALLKRMDKGLLINELMGQGVNRVTGDYSRGAAGFWVENGEIQYPVHEITVAGNLRDMFKRIVAVGNDIDPRRNVRTGSVLLEAMTIAGT